MNILIKKITATILLTILIIFSVANLYHCKDIIVTEIKSSISNMKKPQEISSLQVNIEDHITNELLGRMKFIEIYGLAQKLMKKQEFNNFSFVKSKNGMIYNGTTYIMVNNNLLEYAKRLRRLKNYVESRGKKMLFVLPPYKSMNELSPESSMLPIDDTNAEQDEFMMLLYQNGVPALDLRSAMIESGLAHQEIFFKTDHHWTPKAALYAAGAIANDIYKRYKDNWDKNSFFLNPENYNEKTYKNIMLGSMGKNTGYIYSGFDDITAVWPKFNTNFTWTNIKKNEVRNGPFQESLMNFNTIYPKNIYKGGASMLYIDSCCPLDKIKNHNNSNGPSLLVLRDSYFSPVACFLSPVCSEINMAWCRTSHNPNLDFEKYIKQNTDDYDYVIVEFYPHNLNEKSFAFFEE